RQKILPFFGALAVRYIDRDAAHPYDTAGPVDGCRCCPEAPANLAVRANDAKFGFMGADALVEQAHRLAQPIEIVGMQQRLNIGRIDNEGVMIAPEDPELPFVPHPVAVDPVPVPGTHAAGGECKAAALFA